MLAIWLPATNYIKVTVTEDFLWEPPSTLLELADHFKFGLLTIILWFKSSPWISFHGFISFKDGTTSIEDFTMFILSCFPIMCRLLISILFVGSFLLRPLIMRPVNLVWRRIVESEKPVFTVIFGGAAAFATAISEAAKHLYGRVAEWWARGADGLTY